MNYTMEELLQRAPVVGELAAQQETAWENPGLADWAGAQQRLALHRSDIDDAAARLERFAPFIMKCFPETVPTRGLI